MRTDVVGNQGVQTSQYVPPTGGADGTVTVDPKEAVRPGVVPKDDPGAGIRALLAAAATQPAWPFGAEWPFGAHYMPFSGFSGQMFPPLSVPAQEFTAFNSRITDSGVMRHERTDYKPTPPMAMGGMWMGPGHTATSTADFQLPGGVSVHSVSVNGWGGKVTATDKGGAELPAERVKHPLTGRDQIQVTNPDGTLTLLDPTELSLEVKSPRTGYDSSTQWPGFLMRTESMPKSEQVAPDRTIHLVANESSVVLQHRRPDPSRVGEASVTEVPYSHSYTDVVIKPDGVEYLQNVSDLNQITTRHGEPAVDKGLFGGLFRDPTKVMQGTRGGLVGDTVRYEDAQGMTRDVPLPIAPSHMDQARVEGRQALVELTKQRYEDAFSADAPNGTTVVGGKNGLEMTVLRPDGSQYPLYVGHTLEKPPVLDDRGRMLMINKGRLSAVDVSTGLPLWTSDEFKKPGAPHLIEDGRVSVLDGNNTLHIFDLSGKREQFLAL